MFFFIRKYLAAHLYLKNTQFVKARISIFLNVKIIIRGLVARVRRKEFSFPPSFYDAGKSTISFRTGESSCLTYSRNPGTFAGPHRDGYFAGERGDLFGISLLKRGKALDEFRNRDEAVAVNPGFLYYTIRVTHF